MLAACVPAAVVVATTSLVYCTYMVFHIPASPTDNRRPLSFISTPSRYPHHTSRPWVSLINTPQRSFWVRLYRASNDPKAAIVAVFGPPRTLWEYRCTW